MVTSDPRASATKLAISVAGGQTSKSVWVTRSRDPSMIRLSSAAERCQPFIFQLPAMSGRGALAMFDLAFQSLAAGSRALAAWPEARYGPDVASRRPRGVLLPMLREGVPLSIRSG